MSSANLTLELAKFCRKASYETMNDKAVSTVKASILDTLGCLMSGAASEHFPQVTAGLGLGGQGEAPVLGSRLRAPRFLAAFANGAAAHMESFDDYVVRAGGHAGVSVIPATIASAAAGTTGKQYLAAVLVGYEVMTLLGDQLHVFSYERGYHATGTHGALSSAAASAHLRAFDEQTFAHAIGLAVSQAAGLRVQFGSIAKPLQAGHAAMAGALSANLAAAGCVPSDDPVGGVAGLIECIVGTAERDRIVGLLLESTRREPGALLEESPPTTKLHASCGSTHSAADCAIALRERLSPDVLEKIDRIDIKLPATTLRTLTRHRPETGLEGKYSSEFTVAVGLIYGDASSARFTDEVVHESLVSALVNKSFASADQELQAVRDKSDGALPARVSITIGDEVLTQEIRYPHGAPQAPLTWQEVAGKFRANSQAVLDAARIDAVIDAVANLEQVDDLQTDLIDHLVPA